MTDHREFNLLEEFHLSFYNGRIFLISFLDSHMSYKDKSPNLWDQVFSHNNIMLRVNVE